MLAQYLKYRKISLKIAEEKMGEGRREEKKEEKEAGRKDEGRYLLWAESLFLA